MEKQNSPMSELEKALQEVARVVESNDTIQNVKVTLTFTKPKSSKAPEESR